MPKIIKNGAVVEDSWQGRILELDAYNEAVDAGTAPAQDIAVQLEPDQPPAAISGDLTAIPMIAVNFPGFMDGRGFSYARELRERGYTGEIRAVGDFMRDQLGYLVRCGFDAFDFAEITDLHAALSSMGQLSQQYQADILQPEPLFRRR